MMCFDSDAMSQEDLPTQKVAMIEKPLCQLLNFFFSFTNTPSPSQLWMVIPHQLVVLLLWHIVFMLQVPDTLLRCSYVLSVYLIIHAVSP